MQLMFGLVEALAMLEAYEQMAGPKVGTTRRAERAEQNKKRETPPGLVFPGR